MIYYNLKYNLYIQSYLFIINLINSIFYVLKINYY